MIKSESDCLDCGLPCKYELCEDCLIKEFEVVELEEN